MNGRDGQLVRGDGVPSAGGHGGIGGVCPECGWKLMWTGWGWSAHSEVHHAGARRRLLRSVRELVANEAALRLWLAEIAAHDLVGVRWRNGVYPGWQSEERWEVPVEWWDGLDAGEREELLFTMRRAMSTDFLVKHGVVVNSATWFHKIYDGRTA